jgi:hypothetical protein
MVHEADYVGDGALQNYEYNDIRQSCFLPKCSDTVTNPVRHCDYTIGYPSATIANLLIPLSDIDLLDRLLGFSFHCLRIQCTTTWWNSVNPKFNTAKRTTDIRVVFPKEVGKLS